MTKEEKWIFDEKYAGNTEGAQSTDFLNDCKRLETGEPLAYIIGSIPFLNSIIFLDSKPLIPRPETEFWTEKAIEAINARAKFPYRGSTSVSQIAEMKGHASHLEILDLCAGSGCIGVAVAKTISEAKVTFGEIDPIHLPLITKNLKINHIIDDMNTTLHAVVQSDLFENITGTFDFILTNPPYIDAKANTVEKSVEDNEPSLALFGGTGGFEIIEKIITNAQNYLNPLGELWIEHEPSQVAQIQTLGQSLGFMVITHNDQYDIPRYTTLVLQ